MPQEDFIVPDDLQSLPLLSSNYEWSGPQELGETINTPEDEMHPTLSGDGLTLIFLRSGKACQASREMIGTQFRTAKLLIGLLNDGSDVDSPSLSQDGLTMCFSSRRTGTLGENDLWISHRNSLEEPFSDPESLGSEINTALEQSTPSLSSDLLTLFNCTDNGDGNVDIYCATRNSMGERFQAPVRLDGGINREGSDFFPRLTASDRVLIYTTSSVGIQQFRISIHDAGAMQNQGSIAMPDKINTGTVGSAAFSTNGEILIYDSNRTGGVGGFDLWLTTRIPKR